MVIDRNARDLTGDPEWRRARPLRIAEVPESIKSRVCVAVSVATAPYVPIERELFDAGFDHIVPFYDLAESFRHLHPLSNGWFAPLLTEEDLVQTAEVLERWDDDLSRAHHLQFLAWRRLRQEWSFEGATISADDRFFIPEITSVLHGKEIFVDGGAYHGRVAQAFIERTQGKFRQIIAVEPDPWNRARLRDTLQPLIADRRVSVLNHALAGAEGEALFHDGLGYASQLSETGQMRVTVRPLDALGLSPSFLKLHLEGGELAALKGARQSLVANRPLIAATIYHNEDGIWRTPHWLMQTLSDYRFLFRAHSWCGTGAVLYAIPHERVRH
jgi:FkbM family methyltransferase